MIIAMTTRMKPILGMSLTSCATCCRALLKWRKCSAASHRLASLCGSARVVNTRLVVMSSRSRKTSRISAQRFHVYPNSSISWSSENLAQETPLPTKTFAFESTKSCAFSGTSKNTISTTKTSPSGLPTRSISHSMAISCTAYLLSNPLRPLLDHRFHLRVQSALSTAYQMNSNQSSPPMNWLRSKTYSLLVLYLDHPNSKRFVTTCATLALQLPINSLFLGPHLALLCRNIRLKASSPWHSPLCSPQEKQSSRFPAEGTSLSMSGSSISCGIGTPDSLLTRASGSLHLT